MNLSEEISKILEYHVEPLGYKKAFNAIDRFGTFNAKKQIDVFAVVLEHIERIENGQTKTNTPLQSLE